MHRLILSIAMLVLAVATVRADVKPNPLFSDHMVLQAGMPVPIWGKADPGEKVTVKVQGRKQSAAAGADGKWMVRLPKLKAGGPLEMTISGRNTITVKDVLVGEVWLGSGQSNMVFTLSKKTYRWAGVIDEEKEIAAANHPQIRMFTAKEAKRYEPQETFEGEWQICNPENAPGFSAVGYYFARQLQKEIRQPVGILSLAYGASTAESWIRRETVAADPQLKPMLDRFDAAVDAYRKNPSAPVENPNPRTPRDPVQDQHNATVLYNGMIHPAVPYAIRGVIWYQGESIVGGRDGIRLYPHVMETLVLDWRKLWGMELPFYAVQLAALQANSNSPTVREVQAAILSLPKTGLAVTIDIGDPKDVHPHNKAPLGDRLARIALANVYGRKMEYSGPRYDSMKVEGSSVRLTFTHAAGLMAKGGSLQWFQIAGEDKKFVKAEARIENGTVIVSSPDVSVPVAVRYAWESYPEGANLYNGSDLPAAPFRTDKW